MSQGVTGNPQYNDPSWLSSFLQQHEGEQIQVSTGPGGLTIHVAGESVFIGPSQSGVMGTFTGHHVLISGDINPSYPFLLPGSTEFTLNEAWVTYFVNY